MERATGGRKMKKIVLKICSIILLLALALSICMLCACKTQYVLLNQFDCHEQNMKAMNYESNFIESEKKYKEVIHYYKDSNDCYTDNFGGGYVDSNGIYNICIVGGNKPIVSNYLIYIKVVNSINFLESICDLIEESMTKFSVWHVGICVQCNKVKICLKDKNQIKAIIGELKSKSLYERNSLMFFVGESTIEVI